MRAKVKDCSRKAKKVCWKADWRRQVVRTLVHWEALVPLDWVVRRQREVQRGCLLLAVESPKVYLVRVDCLEVLQCQVLVCQVLVHP